MNGKQGLRKGAIWTGSHLLELSYILSLLVFPAACIVETFCVRVVPESFKWFWLFLPDY